MFKRLTAMLLCMLMVFGLVACGDAEDTAGETTQGTEASEDSGRLTATITVGHNFDDIALEAVKAQLTTFNSRFGGVEVVFKQYQDAITAENAPNVLICTPDEVPAYQEAGLLAPMDSWINSTGMVIYATGETDTFGLTAEQKSDMDELFVQEGKQFGDNATYMLPFARHALVMYYNGTFFEENDMATPFTWEELLEACRQIKAKDPDCIPLAINDVDEVFITMCTQEGVDYTAENWEALFGEEGQEIARTFNTMYQEGLVTTSGIEGRSCTLADNENLAKHYVVIGSSASAKLQRPKGSGDSYAYEVEVFSLPQVNLESPKTMVFGTGMVIFNSEDDDEMTASWLLAKYLCADVEAQATLAAKLNFLPVMQSAWIHEAYATYLDAADGSTELPALAAMACMDQDRGYFTASAFANSGKIRKELPGLLDKTLQLTGEDVPGQIATAFGETKETCK